MKHYLSPIDNFLLKAQIDVPRYSATIKKRTIAIFCSSAFSDEACLDVALFRFWSEFDPFLGCWLMVRLLLGALPIDRFITAL